MELRLANFDKKIKRPGDLMQNQGEKEKPEMVSEESTAQGSEPVEEKSSDRSQEAQAEQAVKEPLASEECPSIEPSDELKQALDEAVRSFEETEEKKDRKAKEEKEQPPVPTEQELKLKMEILELRHRVKELEAEVEKKAREVKQNYEQGMMIKNQFEAYKARVMREKADWFNYGHEPIIKDLLTVLDNFERALSHAQSPSDFDALKQGIEMIYRQLLKVLEQYGVKQISALGENFDPSYHEAVSQIITDEHPAGKVIEEHNKGYMLKDRLLRASRVTISAVRERKKEMPSEPEPKESAEVKNHKDENPEKEEGEES